MFSNKQIYNCTFDSGASSSREVITQCVDKAYFARDGKYLKVPDWKNIGGASSTADSKKLLRILILCSLFVLSLLVFGPHIMK